MIPRLLLVMLISFPTALYSASSNSASYQQPVLLLYNQNDLPAGKTPVYSEGGMALAFGDPTALTIAQPVLPSESGDYYLLHLHSPDALAPFADSLSFVILGQTAIIRTTPEKTEILSGYGWGLTRLMEIKKTASPGEAPLYPGIAVADSNISNLVSAITPESSRRLIADLSAIPTRHSYYEGCRQAEQYINGKFDSLNLSTSFFDFQYNSIDMRDVIGQLNGLAHPESVIIICAHLDCTSEIPSQRAPGAEDNGTGAAVVLEAARVLSQCRTDLSVRFITFSGEEQGLIGSDRYASYVLQQGQNIAAVINVDMVGYSGLYAQDMHIFSDRNSYALGAFGAQILASYTSLDTVPHYNLSPEYGSDHYPFATRGYSSIFFIDAWQGFDWYPNYHTVADTVGNLNMNQQAAIGRAVAAMAITLARFHTSPDITPGDANGTGDVNGLDVVYLVNYLKGLGPAPSPILRGDSNGDCATNGLDVVYLVSYLKGGPRPFSGNCE
jgi:hypothetical protein